MGDKTPSGRRELDRVLGLVLLTSTITAYWYVQHCGFLHFDDPEYVTENFVVQNGLNRASLSWAFKTFHSSNWHPLTWLSHILDCSLYGLNPAGHHLTNLLFHLGNALLLFLFLREATHKVWQSFLVAGLFSLHPLHVESVAWVSERKDVLSTFFWMLALLAYASYLRQSGRLRYLLVLLLFALGLMAKPMLVTFPFVLLLLDYWPFNRFRLSNDKRDPAIVAPSIPLKDLLWEKIPFFILSAASSVMTVLAQSEGRAVRTLESLPLPVRIENAFVSYIHYLSNTFWPHDLMFFYPHPGDNLQPWLVFFSAFLLFTVSLASFRLIRDRPYFFVGWSWYLGTLLPVIGIVQVGDQAMADRYTYIPLIGLFVVTIWGGADFFQSLRVRPAYALLLACAVFIALFDTTRTQVRSWQTDASLAQKALKVDEQNYVAHLLLSHANDIEENLEKAHFHKQRAMEINPGAVALLYNRWGYFALENGQPDEAISAFQEAIRIRPDYANAHNNLGAALVRKGQFNDAVSHLKEALRMAPSNGKYLENLQNLEAYIDRIDRSNSNTP